jgi:CRP/FNR family cyclic AMP-dependent transcriptional regulator
MSALWYIENVDMYTLLCPHKFAEYSKNHQFKSFGKEDVIYWEEDAASSIYLIAEGKVKIVVYGENGEERIKAILGKGELFGEMALFGAEKRRECAVAIDTNTVLCPMSAETMNNLMRDYKDFALGIRKLIGGKLQKIERRMEILLFKDAETRLREFIKDLASESGQKRGETVIIKHIYTQQNIADLIGLARPTLNQIFNDLRAQGALDFKRGEICIKNRQMFAI